MSSVQIHLSRGPCEGFCPVYALTLYGDGRAEYDGKWNIAVKGRQSYRVEQVAVHHLITRLYEIGFFGLCGNYSEPTTDRATVETALQVQGVMKTVSVYGIAAPDGLQELDAQIDAVAGVSRFLNSHRTN